MPERCGNNGGQGIGAGHVCICTGTKGHEPFMGVGHGCSCGALWKDPATKGVEAVMRGMDDVILDHRFTRRGECACGAVIREMDPALIARHLAGALAAEGFGYLGHE